MVEKLKDPLKKKQIWTDWYYNGQNLHKLAFLYTRIATFRKLMREVMAWKTEDDLLELFHGKADIVKELIQLKSKKKHWRPRQQSRSKGMSRRKGARKRSKKRSLQLVRSTTYPGDCYPGDC